MLVNIHSEKSLGALFVLTKCFENSNFPYPGDTEFFMANISSIVKIQLELLKSTRFYFLLRRIQFATHE